MAYRKPPFDTLIVVRDKSKEPANARTSHGHRARGSVEWGTEVWAGRRDRRPFDEVAEGIQLRGHGTVFTVYGFEMPADLPADFSVYVPDERVEYQAAGAPILRGGAMGRTRETYLELWCERKQVRAFEPRDQAQAFSPGFSAGFR